MNQLAERTPQVIAAEIDSIKGQARNVMVLSSIEIGRRLIEAKDMIAHGEWGKWLEESVDYSQSTANNLMQLYREYGEDASKIPSIGNLTYTKAVALLGVPADEREAFVAENDVETMSASDLKKLIKEKQKAEKQLEKAEKLAANEKEAREAVEKEKRFIAEQVKMLTEKLEASDNSSEIMKLEHKIKHLEKQLKDKPIEAATVEVIPEAVEKELEELRRLATGQTHPASMKFRFQFEALASNFKVLLEALTAVPGEEQEKYKNAVAGLIERMKERL